MVVVNDPWADENDQLEEVGGEDQELEREARRRRDQFWSEGYREGIEEGKKATVQEGFNLGFKEGATAGLAYGQVRGAACSVAIFAGQVPGSSRWKESIAETFKTMEQLAAPVDAVRAARVDFERGVAAEANGGEPATPLRRAEDEEGEVEGGADERGGAEGAGGSRSGGGDAGDAGGEMRDGEDDDAGVGSPLNKSKGAEMVDSSGGSAGRGGDGNTFAGRMHAAKSELESAGFELHDFKLT